MSIFDATGSGRTTGNNMFAQEARANCGVGVLAGELEGRPAPSGF